MPEPAPDGVPRWFWLLSVVPSIGVTVVGGAALVLAMLGWYSLPLALALGLPLLALGVFLAVRAFGSRRAVTRADLLGAIGAVAVALASLAFNGIHPSQHVLIDRDPGSYGVTARWLARDGALRVDATTGAFEGAPPGVRFNSAATYDTGDGELEFQFNHLVSASLAMAYGIGGQRLLFRLPAVAAAAALLPLYAFTRALALRAWVALAVTAGFAACLPLVSVARGTYSESFTLLLLWAGMLVLVRVVESRGDVVAAAVVAGGLIGATTMTRIDAVAHLVPLVPVAAWLWGERRRAAAFALVGSAAVAALIGAIDGRYFSGTYYADLATQRRQLEWLLVLVTVISVLAVFARRWVARALAMVSRQRVAVGLGVATFTGLLIAWLVRPSVMTTRGPPNALVSGLQQRQGLPVDPTRLYSEDSLHWFAWYLGPITVLAAAAGAGLLVVRALGRRQAPAIVLSVVLLFGGLIYLWRPSITPDHIWVMRRFVPLVLPAFLVMAGLAIGWLADAARRRSTPLVGGALAVAGSAVLVVPPALVTAPVRRLAEQAGYLQPVQEICRQVPDDAAVVVAGSFATLVLPESLRAWCGVPVAAMTPDATGEDLWTLAEGWAAECRPLVLVAQDEPATTTLLNEMGPDRVVVAARNDRLLERVVDDVPSHYQPEALTVTVGVVPVVDSCVSSGP